MRCLICGEFSLKYVCNFCHNEIEINPKCREFNNFKVYSFFDYSAISHLLYAKYHQQGFKIYDFLANKAVCYLKKCVESYNSFCIGVDDGISNGYSHNAVILRHFKQIGLIPLYSFLHAQNAVKYAGKSLDFRQKNPRNFMLKKEIPQALLQKGAVLIDDIVTTGTTLREAKAFLEKQKISVHCAFVLSDASK